VDLGARTYKILGILNLTPDSFSDGGAFSKPTEAMRRFEDLLREGADFIDVGAESTRPGAKDVSESDELDRLLPFLNLVEREGLLRRVSVDTRKPTVMKQVASMKVSFINNVGPLPDQEELSALFKTNPGLSFIACHMHGNPDMMQTNPLSPGAATKRVTSYFESASEELIAAGCAAENIYMDPGIGFGKTDAANWKLLLATPTFSRFHKVAIGLSRKGFIGRALGGESPLDRDTSSKILEGAAVLAGAALIRTHDVGRLIKFSSILSEAVQ
jgi:dihydropteroate synthase